MIQPDEFYNKNDYPDSQSTGRMWNSIRNSLRRRRTPVFSFIDRRSFMFGAAAALLLWFAGIGIVSMVRQSVDTAKPGEERVDEAYLSAIEEFEKIIPSQSVQPGYYDVTNGYLTLQYKRLLDIDTAISDFKREIGSNDYSPLIRQRLRQLYRMKLAVIQELLNQGVKEL